MAVELCISGQFGQFSGTLIMTGSWKWGNNKACTMLETPPIHTGC
jgi:hypothetical protein